MRNNAKYGREVAKDLIDEKRRNMRNGEMGKDVLSLLSERFRGCKMIAEALTDGPPNSLISQGEWGRRWRNE